MTIKDLAEKTGYAVGTVSRALNGHPHVSQKARMTILEAAQEWGFQPNQNARQLKQRRSTTILAVVKGREIHEPLLEAVQALVGQSQYQLAVDTVAAQEDEVLRALALCQEKKPLGILFLGGDIQNFRKHFGSISIPAVLLGSDGASLPFPNLSSVATDHRRAGRQALETLLSLGHRRIAILGSGEPGPVSHLRFLGCLDAFQEQGIDFDPEQDYQEAEPSCQGGYQAAQALLAQGQGYTALLALSDEGAIGAIRALHEAGLRVPEDVSVMGMDGLPLGSYLVPSLATVNPGVGPMARRGVEILFAAMDGGPACHQTIPFQICPRETIRMI